MARRPSERDIENGAPQYLPMKNLNSEEIYTVMSPLSPVKKKMHRNSRKSLDITQHPSLLPFPTPPMNPGPPPPLPPKRIRRSVSLNPTPPPRVQLLEDEVRDLKEKLQKRDEDLLKTWMNLIQARKLALQAHRQKQKRQALTVLMIFLLVCLILSVMLYFLIRQ
ncbi:Alto [Philantomba monticola polyomavirus 1]|uniref:Alto n=1 Tax=Philantomba monticola polyomavirus 1 TaxID=2170411 RepID=A0A2S1CJJ7_9POLY|nr:Alto [Philantomba monticola polyomavirus 1]AWD33738.1 Alto [Philantomba monticola polyomavirus 1]